jgi:hypothetical protein
MRRQPSRSRSSPFLAALTDAVADFTDAAHRAAVEISYPTYGHEVMTIERFLASIEPV